MCNIISGQRLTERNNQRHQVQVQLSNGTLLDDWINHTALMVCDGRIDLDMAGASLSVSCFLSHDGLNPNQSIDFYLDRHGSRQYCRVPRGGTQLSAAGEATGNYLTNIYSQDSKAHVVTRETRSLGQPREVGWCSH